MPSEMSERDRIKAAIAASRGMSEAEMQRAIYEAMRVGPNRWAAFTDDELDALVHLYGWANDDAYCSDDAEDRLIGEVKAELERRRSDG